MSGRAAITPIGFEVMDLGDPRATWIASKSRAVIEAATTGILDRGSVAYEMRYWADGITERRTIRRVDRSQWEYSRDASQWELRQDRPFWNLDESEPGNEF